MKNRKFYLNKNAVLSGVAKWAVYQSPYHRPENLEMVLDKLEKIIDPLFDKNEYGDILELSYEEIKEFVFKNTTAIPEFEAWNVAKKPGGDGSSSRYHMPNPDYDFIDLHALARNVANDIVWDAEGGKTPIPVMLGEGKLVG